MRTPRDSRPRTKPPEDRREELLSAAERLFLSHGAEATTVEQITAAADTGKGTFYLYFNSKEEMRAALGERIGLRLKAKIEAAVEKQAEGDWGAGLAAWAETCLAGLTAPDSVLKPSQADVIVDDLVELLEAGAEDGAWSLDDPRTTAVFLLSGLRAVAKDSQNSGADGLSQKIQGLFFKTVGL